MYSSENTPDVISESLKLNFSWGSMFYNPLLSHVVTHTDGGLTLLSFSKHHFCPPLGNVSKYSTGSCFHSNVLYIQLRMCNYVSCHRT